MLHGDMQGTVYQDFIVGAAKEKLHYCTLCSIVYYKIMFSLLLVFILSLVVFHLFLFGYVQALEMYIFFLLLRTVENWP